MNSGAVVAGSTGSLGAAAVTADGDVIAMLDTLAMEVGSITIEDWVSTERGSRCVAAHADDPMATTAATATAPPAVRRRRMRVVRRVTD
jgi:hypothetical protein